MKIKDAVEQRIRDFERIGHTPILDHFLARNGETFHPQRWKGKRGKPKQCFQNATQLTQGVYAEGYVWRGDLPILILHAWRVDENDRVLDPTIDRPENCQYFGIKIPETELARELLRNEVYGILDTGLGYNMTYMLYRDPGMAEIIPTKKEYQDERELHILRSN